MAGIGDSWGTKEELLHPRGPDGRWIRKGGIAKSIIARIMDALASFRPRMFQSQGQANQYLKNVASRKQSRFQGGRGYGRLLSDLGPTNEDLRDGVIDNPSTSKFIKMMDESATELPDDVILTRHVGVDAFGFTPQTATGTNSDTDPGIRALSGKLIADRGYSTTTVGEPRGAPPQGSVRMVIAARKGTKVVVPASGENDSVVFLDRDQPLRVTKIEPDGSGGWVMYALTDEKKGPRETPVPIAGPIGAGVRDPKQREAAIRDVERIRATREQRPDDTAEAADEAERRRKFEETQGQEQVPSPQQEAERKRVEALQQQSGVQPRTEPIQARSIGGQPRPEGAPGAAPPAPTPGAPEAATPRRAVDLRLAVRDAGIPAPTAGPNRKRFNDAYEGIISGKKDPIDAARELDRDAADLRAAGDGDADNLEQLSELIKREYGLEQPAPAKKAGKATAPEAAPAPPPVPAPAKKAPAKKAGGMSRDQEDRVIARAREFRDNPRNSEEQRIVDTADQILAERRGGPAPAKLAAPAKKAAPAAELTPEQEIKGLFNGKRPTNAQLREMGERNNLGFGPKEPRSEMILAILGARPRRGQQVGEVPVAPKKTAKKVSVEDRVAARLLERMNPEVRDEILADMPEADRRAVDEAVERVKEAGPPTPRKRAAKKAAPALSEQESRVQEIMGRENKPTVIELRAFARENNVSSSPGRPLSKMTREQLISAIINDVGPRFGRQAGFKPRQPEAPEAPAPVKKAAKAAVPGAAPGTAAGKITAGRLKAGDQVLVTQNNSGDWVPSTRKTGQTRLTIEGISQAPGHAGFRRTTTRLVLTGRDENGNEVQVASVPGHQTFIVAPEPGAAPAKKAAKAAAPAPSSVPDIMARLNDFDNPPSREEAAAMVAPLRRAQLLEMAKELNVPGASKKTMPELKREIVEGTVGRRRDSAAVRGFTELRPEAVTVTDERDSVQIARDRQARIDRAKSVGGLLAEIDELIDSDVDDKTFQSRIGNRLARETGISNTDAVAITRSFKDMDRARARDWLARMARGSNVEFTEKPGDIVPFDRKQHAGVGGVNIPEGTQVRISRPGYIIHEQDGDIRIRGTVEVATPDEVRSEERGKRLVPEGSVAGDRAQAPVSNEPRKRNFDEAWDAAELGAEGSPERSMKEIRDDVASGKITPEEGIRRMEDEIAFNKEDLAEVDANLRQPDLSDEERDKLQTNAAVLTNGIEAQEKASKFLRMYFKNEEISAPEAKELITLDLTGQDFKALQDASVEDLREAARLGGLDPPKGKTKDEVLKDMVMQVARQVAEERGIVPKKAPAKKAAKAAKKVAPEVPKVTPERGKVDVRAIGSDLDVPEGVLHDVQVDLDKGDKTPAEIGRDLEQQAQRRRNTATIMHGSWGDSLRDMSDPDEIGRAETDRAAHEQMMREADSIDALAQRLKKTRRPAVKKVAAKKAAPEVVQAEAKVDDLEARIINKAVADLQEAKTREQGNDALEGLTMGELRRLLDHLGMERSRSKQSMKDSLLDRFALPPAAIREAIAEPPKAPPLKRISARAKDAGIDRPTRTFSGVEDAEGRANQMLQRGESNTEIARMLRERAAQVAKADLNEEGRRFNVEIDKDTLRSLRKSNADYLRRLGTMLQQEEKAPAKKAALTPEVSPSRTGTSPVGGTKSTTPEIKNNWGMLGTGGPVEFHDDGVIGQGIQGMGEDRLMDVDGEPLSNVLGKMATRAVRGEISQEQLLDELRSLGRRLPEGSKARRSVANMVDFIDGPKRNVDIPEGTPAPIAALIQELLQIPLARDRVDRPGFYRSREDSEVDKVLKLLREFQEGRTGGLRFINEFQDLRRSLPHESQEGRFEADRAFRRVVEALEAMYKEDRRSLIPRTPTGS